jgi:hypothetical protein
LFAGLEREREIMKNLLIAVVVLLAPGAFACWHCGSDSQGLYCAQSYTSG